jgi:hypothetical protein
VTLLSEVIHWPRLGMDGPHLRHFEPQPQQVPPPVLLGIAVVERGARMEDRVVVDEVNLAGLQREFQHQFGPLGNLLEPVEHPELGLAHQASGRRLARLDIGADVARRDPLWTVRALVSRDTPPDFASRRQASPTRSQESVCGDSSCLLR